MLFCISYGFLLLEVVGYKRKIGNGYATEMGFTLSILIVPTERVNGM